jgi:hypothetical protein
MILEDYYGRIEKSTANNIKLLVNRARTYDLEVFDIEFNI